MKSRLVWCQPGPGAVATARPGCHLRTYAPAGSLGSAFAGLRRGAGRNRIAAGANQKERPAISALPRPCPVPPPTLRGAPCRAHALPVRRAADRFALLRGFGRPGSAIARRGNIQLHRASVYLSAPECSTKVKMNFRRVRYFGRPDLPPKSADCGEVCFERIVVIKNDDPIYGRSPIRDFGHE